MGKEEEVKTIISADDQATSVIKNIGALMAATFSIAAVTAFGKAAVESATAQEDAEMKLAQALGYHSEALNAQAAALQKTTKFADEQVIAAQASLAMFTKDEEQLKQLTKATLDFAAAKGIDLVSAANIVGKSFGGEVSMLGRYGVATEGATGSTERLASILDGLGARFGGQAEAQAQTFSGTLTRVKNAADNMMESFGDVIVRNPVVITAMKMLAGAFDDLGSWVQKNQIWLMELVQTGLVWFVRGVGYAISIIGSFELAWRYLKVGADTVIHAISFALQALITPFEWLFDKLVSFGALKANPLKGLADGIEQFRNSSKDVLSSSIADVDTTISKYGELGGKIQGFADTLAGVKVVATEVKDSVVANSTETAEAVIAQDQRMIDSSWWASVQRIQFTEMMTRADQMAGNIRNAAFKSMETQLMRLVEVHRFSAAEFGKAIMQSVKAELIGIAARATVWALFETAMGLATMFTNPAASGAHFASAGTFASIAGATVAAAAAVNVLSGPGAQTASSGTPGSSPSNPSYTSGVPEPSTPQSGTTQVTHVNVNVYNPLTQQNWDEVMELDIVPAIHRAQQRGVT